MAHLSPTVFHARRKQLLGKMLLDYHEDKQARLKKRDEELAEKKRMMALVADARKPDSVGHFTFRDLAPGEENAFPQPIAIDFGDLLLGTDCLIDACLDVGVGVGSAPEAWAPQPMMIDSGAAAEAAAGEAEYTDTESIASGYGLTESEESDRRDRRTSTTRRPQDIEQRLSFSHLSLEPSRTGQRPS